MILILFDAVNLSDAGIFMSRACRRTGTVQFNCRERVVEATNANVKYAQNVYLSIDRASIVIASFNDDAGTLQSKGNRISFTLLMMDKMLL